MKTRRLRDGRAVALHTNSGLRKRCTCARRKWATCPHGWHLNFAWKGAHYRLALDKHAPAPIRDKADAQSTAEGLKIAIRAGTFRTDPTPAAAPATPDAITFTAFGKKWFEHARDGQIGCADDDQACLNRLSAALLPSGERFGDRLVGAITTDDVEMVFRTFATKAGSTWNKYRQTVLHLQKFGLKKGYLARAWLTDDCEIQRKRSAKRSRRLTPDASDPKTGKLTEPGEERRLLAVANPWLQRLIIAALETGCRRGELLTLTWADVSLVRSEILIHAERAKSRKARHLPISTRLRAVLDMVRNDPRGEPHKPEAHVFGNALGEPVADCKKAFLNACTKAGIDGLHFHDLRHEAGSRFLEAGWPVTHVQAMLGHANLATTSIYLNVTKTGLADSMKRFGSGSGLHDLAQDASTENPPPVQEPSPAAEQVTVN